MNHGRGKGRRKSRIVATAATAFSIIILVFSTTLHAKPTRHSPMNKGGLEGSGESVAQLVTVPARVARVAEVPGTQEVWGLGLSSSMQSGWNPNRSVGGQVVFLRYRPQTGWSMIGPPKDGAGNIINPGLHSFDLAANGEGWAVGQNGLLLRKQPDSNDWIVHPSAAAGSDTLNDVSIASDGQGVFGFAAGTQGTIIRLAANQWQREDTTGLLTSEGLPEFASVAAVSRSSAWVITGSGHRSLYVFRKSGSEWARVTTGDAMFDGPHPNATTRGFTINAAIGASVASDASGAWVGGSILPSDPTHPFGNQSSGDPSKPFVIHFGASATSYCPDIYWARVDQQSVQTDTTTLCDSPFPLSAFEVTDLQIVPGTNGPEVFGSGLGVYRFTNNSSGWFREPNPNGYLISIAMTSASEGWAASTGNTFGAGGAIHSSTSTLAHFTSSPPSSRLARWPIVEREVMQSVAASPDGTRAIAVGSKGSVASFEASTGWNAPGHMTIQDLHGAAWPGGRGWAVGQNGSILSFDGAQWSFDPAHEKLTKRSLFALAFSGENRGYAVGMAGTILRYDGERWQLDPATGRVTGANLTAIAADRDGFVAVGEDGTVIENFGSGWRARPDMKLLVSPPGEGRGAADLWAVTPISVGRFLLGGGHSSLAVRATDGSYSTFASPVEGTVIALASAGSGGNMRIFASVSPDEKFKGDRIATGRSVLLAWENGGWRDIQRSRTRSAYHIWTDPSAPAEAILSLAMVGPDRGWGAGGSPENLPDDEGHLAVSPNGSIYRFDLSRDPAPRNVTIRPNLPADGISFAFFAESGCGRGLCSATVGSNTRADTIALQIRDEINRLTGLPGGPRFVVFGGNSRSEGIPEEIRQFEKFLDGFDVPVYGALGNKELFDGLESSSFGYPSILTPLSAGLVGSNRYWLENLSDRPAPWGDGSTPNGIQNATGASQSGLARTFYSFDYAPAGTPLFRMIVLNSSTRSYGRTDGRDQNPQVPQSSWFADRLVEGRITKQIPMIVAMNQPTIIPSSQQLNNWTAAPQDKSSFESSVVANKVSAVLTGGLRINSVGWLPTREAPLVPTYILGGGGAPLGGLGGGLLPDSKVPSDGFFHAWHLVTVYPSKAVDGQMPVEVRTFPVLDSVALKPHDGRIAQAGRPLRFSAIGRATPGGISDPEQSKADYMTFGWDAPIPCSGPGAGFGFCRSISALVPDHYFYSENPAIADFVMPQVPLANVLPQKTATGALVKDVGGRMGFLCTFNAGSTFINVIAGTHRARIPITVTGGFGPCVDREVTVPGPVPPPSPEVVPQPAQPFLHFTPDIPQPLALIFAPPPVPVVAPAPPASLGLARKEEVEEAEESEGQAVRIDPASRYETSPNNLVVVAGIVIAAFALALAFSSRAGGKPATAEVAIEQDRWGGA